MDLTGEQGAKIFTGEIVDTEGLGKIVAGAYGQDGKRRSSRLFLCHQAIDDLVDHAVAAERDNGTVALGLCGKFFGVSHVLGQHQIKLG